MKLSSDPKPVKFRIVSGGEEHSSLDSLRQNFCISDLQKIETQLILWLKRQGAEGEEIAKQLNLSELNSVDDYFAVYKLFFQKEFKDNKIDTPLQLLEYWYDQKRNFENIDQLSRLGFEKDDAIKIFCYRHRNEISGLTDNWLTILKNIHAKTEEIEKWIKDEVKKIEQVDKRDVNITKIKRHIRDVWLRDYDCRHYDPSYSNDEKAILRFSGVCYNCIVRYHMTYNKARKDFCLSSLNYYKSRFTLQKESDFLFNAKYLVLLLLYKHTHLHITDKDWITEFFNGLSLKQNQIAKKYYNAPVTFRADVESLIKKFILNDLFKFIDLE